MGSTSGDLAASLIVWPNPDRAWERATFSGATVVDVMVTDKFGTKIDGTFDRKTQIWSPWYPHKTLGGELTVTVTQMKLVLETTALNMRPIAAADLRGSRLGCAALPPDWRCNWRWPQRARWQCRSTTA